MKRSLSILGIVIFIAIFAYFAQPLFMPPAQSDRQTDPFWVIETTPNSLTVFDLTLNQSSLRDLIDVLGNRLDLSVFEQNGEYQLEGYIRETFVGGLTARIPFTLQASQSELKALTDPLTPSKKSLSTHRIYEISEDQHPQFYDHIVQSLSFIPIAVTLDEAVILGRFGAHPLKLQEANNGIIHYLYPEKGVDILLDPKGEARAVVQYSTPDQFQTKVIDPLYENGATQLPVTQ